MQSQTQVLEIQLQSSLPPLPPAPPLALSPASVGKSIPPEANRALDSTTCFGRDPARSNVYPESFANVELEIAQNWSASADGDLTGSFVVAQNRLCFSGSFLSCFELLSLERQSIYNRLWSQSCKEFSSILYDSSSDMFIGVLNNGGEGQPGALVGILASNGSVTFSVPLDEGFSAPPAQFGPVTAIPISGTVSFFSSGIKFADNGLLGGDYISTPAFGTSSNTVVVATNTHLFALQLPAANILWKTPISDYYNDIANPVLLCDGLVVVTASPSMGINATTGAMLWNGTSTGGNLVNGAALDCESRIFLVYDLSDDQRVLVARDIVTGKIQWSVPTPYSTAFTVVGEIIYNVGALGVLEARSLTNGSLVWKSSISIWPPGNIYAQMANVAIMAADHRLLIVAALSEDSGGGTQVYVLREKTERKMKIK